MHDAAVLLISGALDIVDVISRHMGATIGLLAILIVLLLIFDADGQVCGE